MRPAIRTLLAALLSANICVGSAFSDGVVITGRVLGADSNVPLSVEAWVGIRDASTGEWIGWDLSKRGEESYRVELPNIGRYILYPLYGPFWHDEWDLQTADKLAAESFEVNVTASTTEQDVTLPDPIRIRLRAVDAIGNPLEGTRAAVSRMRPKYERDYGAMSLSRETDENGRCEWLVMPGHEIWISANAEGYTWKASDHFSVARGDEVPEITLTLRRPGAITATLVDANGRPKPKTNYRLTVHDLQGAYLKGMWARTDARGQLVVPDFLVRDELRVSLFSSSKHTPDFETIYEGPADINLALGSVYAPARLQP